MYMLQDRLGQMLPSGPEQPCSHLDLRNLSSRPGRQQCSGKPRKRVSQCARFRPALFPSWETVAHCLSPAGPPDHGLCDCAGLMPTDYAAQGQTPQPGPGVLITWQLSLWPHGASPTHCLVTPAPRPQKPPALLTAWLGCSPACSSPDLPQPCLHLFTHHTGRLAGHPSLSTDPGHPRNMFPSGSCPDSYCPPPQP